MAQTSTKSGASARSARTTSRSNGSQAASRSRRSSASRSSNGSRRTRPPANQSRRGQAKRASAKRASGRGTKTSRARPGTSLGEVVSRAKTPLIAGGAAAAGLAGGVLLGRNGSKQGSPRKAIGVAAKALGSTAVEIGKVGYRIAELTSEVRRVRERVTND